MPDSNRTPLFLALDNVCVRDPRPNDREAMIALADDDRLFAHMMIRFSREDMDRWFTAWLDELKCAARSYWPLVIDLDRSPVGFVMLSRSSEGVAELQWYIAPANWGCGCATAATRLVMPLLFDGLKFHRVFATADPANEASVRTLERAGFRNEGHMVDYVLTHQGWRDRLMYSLLDSDWRRARRPRASAATAKQAAPTFRFIDSGEVQRFSELGADTETHAAVRRYLTAALDAGETSPEMCHVAEMGDEIIGRLVYWSLPGAMRTTMDMFALTWSDDERLAMAPAFLAWSLGHVASLGFETVSYDRHEPDPYEHTPARLIEVLLAAGFVETRVTSRVELSPIVPLGDTRGVDFVGPDLQDLDAFAAAIESMAAGSDTHFNRLAERVGPAEAAKRIVAETAAMRGGSDLWRLARLDNELVGVVMPSANEGGAVLNYLAVAPEHRGRGLVDALLTEAARLHLAAGAERVRADTDTDNRAMLRAFHRAGWKEFGRRTTFERSLL